MLAFSWQWLVNDSFHDIGPTPRQRVGATLFHVSFRRWPNVGSQPIANGRRNVGPTLGQLCFARRDIWWYTYIGPYFVIGPWPPYYKIVPYCCHRLYCFATRQASLLSLAVFHCLQWSLVVFCCLCGNYKDPSSVLRRSAASCGMSSGVLRRPAVFRQTEHTSPE